MKMRQEMKLSECMKQGLTVSEFLRQGDDF